MTLKTLLLACGSVALLGACAAPNEYNTYEVDKGVSSYGGHHDTDHMDMEEDMSAPMDITVPAGRVE